MAELGKLTGWQTLKIEDVLPTVSTALRLYSRNKPLLKMKARRHNLDDGVTEWRLRCDGKPIGSVTLRRVTHGLRFGWSIAPGPRSPRLKFAKHEMAQLAEHIKNRIDFEHLVGEHWDIRGIPSSIQVRKKWCAVYEAVEDYRAEQRRLGYEPSLADIVDYLSPYDPHDPYVDLRSHDFPIFKRSSIKKIIAAGDEGKLDHMKSY